MLLGFFFSNEYVKFFILRGKIVSKFKTVNKKDFRGKETQHIKAKYAKLFISQRQGRIKIPKTIAITAA